MGGDVRCGQASRSWHGELGDGGGMRRASRFVVWRAGPCGCGNIRFSGIGVEERRSSRCGLFLPVFDYLPNEVEGAFRYDGVRGTSCNKAVNLGLRSAYKVFGHSGHDGGAANDEV